MIADAALLPVILDGIRESFYALDRDWRITLFNRGAELHFGRTRDEAARLTIWDLVPTGGTVADTFRRVMAGAGPTLLAAESDTRKGRMLEGRVFPLGDGIGVSFRDVTEQRRDEEALRRREGELARVQRIARVGGLEVDLRSGFVNRRSPEYLALHGLPPEATGESHEDWVRRIHPEDRERVERDFRAAVNGPDPRYAAEYRIVRPSDGEVRWIAALAEIERDTAGRALRLVGAHRDVTDLREAAERQRLLIHELNHRVKNTLATVQSLASQSLRGAETTEAAWSAFESRLLALSRVHNVLTRENWEGAELLDIVNDAVAPFRGAGGGERIRVTGSRLRLTPQTALALAMALQELATNAVKYGALSTETGRVEVAWTSADPVRRLRLRWVESGGPTVSAPARRGFGTRLLERSLATDLAGEVSIAFDPAGVVCTIDASALHAAADG